MTKTPATFTYCPADDDSVDPEWVCDQAPRFTIQDARSYGGGLVVVEHSPDGEPFWCRHHGSHRSLRAAKADLIRRAGIKVAP